MATKDSLGDRMKGYYEEISKTKLTRRTPVIARLDGKAFHTFTRGFEKPFDNILVESMQETMKYLCENVQGCVLGYTQSDEITLVLVDYQTLESSAWFDYEVQKMTSILASMATLAFNRIFNKKATAWINGECNDPKRFKQDEDTFYHINDLIGTYEKAINKGAMFDARVFNIPKEEVTNCVFWRQLDAERNSILSVAQANFSHKEMQGISCKNLVTKLEEEKGIIWGNLPTTLKRGSCCVKKREYILPDGQRVKNRSIIDYDGHSGVFYEDGDGYYLYYSEGSKDTLDLSNLKSIKIDVKESSKWVIDNNIPCFKGEGRDYIEDLINVGE